jgi:hypothetical protein
VNAEDERGVVPYPRTAERIEWVLIINANFTQHSNGTGLMAAPPSPRTEQIDPLLRRPRGPGASRARSAGGPPRPSPTSMDRFIPDDGLRLPPLEVEVTV